MSKEQETIHAMERIIVPLTFAVVVILALLGVASSLIFILAGILMAPLGIIGFIDDNNITLRDNDFSVFIRSFGAIMGGQGTTAVYCTGKHRPEIAYRTRTPGKFCVLETQPRAR